MAKAQDQDKFIVRLPEGMRASIKRAAVANGRSMNAEIVHRLAPPADMATDEDTMDLASKVMRSFEARFFKAAGNGYQTGRVAIELAVAAITAARKSGGAA